MESGDATKWQWSESEKAMLSGGSKIRVLFLGEFMAGKTSLARTIMCDDQYMTAESERTVVGQINFWRSGHDKSQMIMFVDLGGQDSYLSTGHYLHANSLNNVALLCHKLASTTYNKTFIWLKSMLVRSPLASIRIALTQCDHVPEKNREEKKNQFITKLQDWLKKEIKSIETCIIMAKEEESEKADVFTDLLKKYQWIYNNVWEIIFLTSCEEGFEHTIKGMKDTLYEMAQNEENQLQLPEQFKQFFMKIGTIGVKLSKRDHEESIPVVPRMKEKKHVGILAKLVSSIKNMKHSQAEHVETNQEYLTFKEALKVYESVLKEMQLPKKNAKQELHKCLQFLHCHGLLLYFPNNPVLKKIIFHHWKSFFNILRSIFHHEIPEFLTHVPPELKVAAYRNDESKFNDDVRLLTTRGLLSFNLLNILLCKSSGVTADVVSELLNIVEVGFTFTPNDLKEPYIFIPYFIENRSAPNDLKDKLQDLMICEKDMLSLQCHIKGNIPLTFWHYLVTGLFKKLIGGLQSQVLWDRGFWAVLGQNNIRMALLLDESEDCVKFVIKGSTSQVQGHCLMWKFIDYICKETEQLIKCWWPGLVSRLILLCIACLIQKQEKTIHEWSLQRLMQSAEKQQQPETCCCDVSRFHEFPAGLIMPLCKDKTKAKEMLSAVQKYLQKYTDSDCQNSGKMDTGMKLEYLRIGEDEVKNVEENEPPTSVKTLSTGLARSTRVGKQEGRIEKITKSYTPRVTGMKVEDPGIEVEQENKFDKEDQKSTPLETHKSGLAEKVGIAKGRTDTLFIERNTGVKMKHIRVEQAEVDDVSEDEKEYHVEAPLSPKNPKSGMAESAQIGMTSKSVATKHDVYDLGQKLSNQIFLQGKALSTLLYQQGDMSEYPLQCRDPILATYQETILQNMEPDQELLDHLTSNRLLTVGDKKRVENEKTIEGKIKRILLKVNSQPDQIKAFIDSLNECKPGTSNFTLANFLKDRYNQYMK